MKKTVKSMRLLSLIVLWVVVASTFTTPSSASIGNIVKSDLAGSWLIALRGTTGCGFEDLEADVTMNNTGVGTAALTTHGQCGDSVLAGQTFTILTLATNGKGTASLTCGTGCGWNFDIQVAPDRSKFNLVDVSSKNPGNYLEGTAVLSSPSGNIGISDLTGSWQATLYGTTGCGVGTMVLSFTLNSAGVSTGLNETYHTVGCGDGSVTTDSFTILSLNPDGRGTANLTCGAGCGWTFDIQVSPDRSSFNLVDVYSLNTGNFQAGVAINNSTAAEIVPANLTGSWDVAIYSQGGCGIATILVSFTLNATGTTTNATETSHTAGCGNTKSAGNTFTIESLNANGSGTANLTCGTDCGFSYSIQVSPDRSTISLVDVSDPENYQVATAIHE